jgi:hypothetical protein
MMAEVLRAPVLLMVEPARARVPRAERVLRLDAGPWGDSLAWFEGWKS